MTLFEAASQDLTEKLEQALLETRDEEGRNILHWSCSLGSMNNVEAILSRNVIDINAKDNQGWTPLMISVSAAHEAIANILLQNEHIDVNAANNSGATALHLATSKKLVQIARELLSRAPELLRSRDKLGQQPLQRAAASGSMPLVNMYLTYKPGAPVNASDNHGMTALMHACAEGNLDVAQMLVKAGADYERTDKDGSSALDWIEDERMRLKFRQMCTA